MISKNNNLILQNIHEKPLKKTIFSLSDMVYLKKVTSKYSSKTTDTENIFNLNAPQHLCIEIINIDE